MNGTSYRGFTITSRTFQIRGSGRWTLDLLISRRDLLRSFSGGSTYTTEAAAVAGCLAFGQRVIDRSKPGCAVAELKEDAALERTLELRAANFRDLQH